jgi:hypothetical protein
MDFSSERNLRTIFHNDLVEDDSQHGVFTIVVGGFDLSYVTDDFRILRDYYLSVRARS